VLENKSLPTRSLFLDLLRIDLSMLHCRLRATHVDLVVGRVDHQQKVSLVHELIVDNRQLDDAACDLRRNLHDIRADRPVACPGRLEVDDPHRPPEQRRNSHDAKVIETGRMRERGLTASVSDSGKSRASR